MTRADLDRPAGELLIDIPPGFLRMPLERPDEQLDKARDLFSDVADADKRQLVDAVLGSLRVMLADLATAGARYCGVGRHTASTGDTIVTSTLVVSVLEFPEPNDPTALVEALIGADGESGEAGLSEIVTTDVGRPLGLRERVRSLPAPTLPGVDTPPATSAPVYQLSVRVPSFDGTKLATIELSTPFLAEGPEFRTVVFQMAAAASLSDVDPDGV